MTRRIVEGAKKRSLIASVSRMYHLHEWIEDQVRETKKYIIKYRFWDTGPYFEVKDKQTDNVYSVEAYDSFGFKLYWGAYHK